MKDFLVKFLEKEFRIVWAMSFLIILITTLPYLIGWYFTPEGLSYLGLHAITPGDIPVYYSYIFQLQNGALAVKDLFTAEMQSIGTFNVWWFIVAFIGNLFSLSPALAFHLSRILMIPVFCFMLYFFTSYIFSAIALRRTAFIFSLFSAGVGVYVIPFFNTIDVYNTAAYNWPIDVWMSEASVFFTLFQSSHFIASLTLTLVVFLLLASGFANYRLSNIVFAGFSAMILFQFHPYYVPVLYGAILLYVVIDTLRSKSINWKYVLYGFLFFLISVPSALYHVWLLRQNEVILVRATQNVTPAPDWLFIFIGFGGLLCGFYYAVKLFLQHRLNSAGVWLLCWLMASLLLLSSPVQFQSRYVQGMQLALSMFLILGLSIYQKERFQRLLSQLHVWWFMIILIFGVTPLFAFTRDVYLFTQHPGETKELLYLNSNYLSAFEKLRPLSDGVVLAPNHVSLFVPGYTGKSVYYAHEHETVAPEIKRHIYGYVLELLSSGKGMVAYDFLLRNNITYLFLTSELSFVVEDLPFELVFIEGDVQLFAVTPLQ